MPAFAGSNPAAPASFHARTGRHQGDRLEPALRDRWRRACSSGCRGLPRSMERSIWGRGFPTSAGPTRSSTRRRRRCARGRTNMRRRAGCRCCARRSRRIMDGITASTLGRRQCGRHQRRDRGAGGEPAGADRAGRRSDPVHPGLRRLRAAGPARRRGGARGGVAAARLADRARGDRGGGGRRRRARSSSTIRTIRPDACSMRTSSRRSPAWRASMT